MADSNQQHPTEALRHSGARCLLNQANPGVEGLQQQVVTADHICCHCWSHPICTHHNNCNLPPSDQVCCCTTSARSTCRLQSYLALPLRWYKARHGSLMVAAASAGAAAVRKADPVHYPPAPHAYFRLGDHELTAPLLCAVCFEHVEPNNLFQVYMAKEAVNISFVKKQEPPFKSAWSINMQT